MTTGIKSDLNLLAIFEGANLSGAHTQYIGSTQYFLTRAERAGHDRNPSKVEDLARQATMNTLLVVRQQLEGKGSADIGQLIKLVEQVSARLKDPIRTLAVGQALDREKDVDRYVEELDELGGKLAKMDFVHS